jgi:lysophospholipase L1-like esterase
MKKLFAVVFCLCLIFSCNSIGFALGDDVDMEFDLGDNSGIFSVGLEAGKDDGYITNDGDIYTATPYGGNEFLGWYKKGSDTPYSTEATVKLTDGEFTAKFKSNNLVNQNGYELFEAGTNLLGDSWAQAGTQDSWVNLNVNSDYAKSGTKSLKINARQQKDVYLNIKGLKENTDYVVSYSWMLPFSAITATKTMNDGYFGSAIGDNQTLKISACYAKGDYTGNIDQTFVGGQWNKTKYVFNSKNNTEVRLFLRYDSDQNTGNDHLYIDEFMVYAAEFESDNSGFSSYRINVTGENSYAYSLATGAVEPDSEVTVTAAPYGGYKFDGWYEKGVKVSEEQMYTFNVNSNRTLTAKSVKIVDSYVTITPDVNKNNVTDLNDVTSLARHFAGWSEDVNPKVLDINGDENANLKDLVLLAQYVAGWNVEEQFAKTLTDDALPEEDINGEGVRELLLAGQSEYFNKSTIVNNGDKTLLANVIKKAQRGEDITIVGVGGSVTQGGGISDTNRYGEHVSLWLNSKFPNIKVNYVNAGIGSTTSLVGIHRLDTDVLAHNPDLVLVDFTVNDGTSDERYKLSYETIIRKLLKNNIAVVSLVFGSTGDPLNPKRAENAMKSHLPSMIHYNVPVIDYYGALWRYIDNGIVSWNDDLTRDGLHPSDTGHVMIASAVEYYINGILENVESIDTIVPKLPENYLFGSNVYETATFLASTTENNYTKIEPTESINFTAGKVHGAKLGKGWICESAEGGSITFELKNVTSVSIFLQNKCDDTSTPDINEANGKGDIIINGKTVVDNTNCSGGSANGYIWISYNEIFDTPQDLTITITSEAKFGVGPLGVTY